MVAEELLTKEKSVEWVYYLPKLIVLINKHFYQKEIKLTSKQIVADVKTNGPTELLEIGTNVRVQLDKPVNVINGERLIGKFRVGDIRWSMNPTKIDRIQLIPNQPVLYKLEGYEPLYTREQLQVITKSILPPKSVQKKFIVDEILEKKKIKNIIHYLIKWQGYDTPTWEPRKTIIIDVPDMVKQFEANSK